MLSKWNKVLLAVMIMAVLVMPMGLVGADTEDPVAQEGEILTGSITGDSELFTIEKIDSSDMIEKLERATYVEADGNGLTDFSSQDRMEYDVINKETSLFELDYQSSSYPEMGMNEMTRAEDDESQDDYHDWANASVIDTQGEVIDGTLAYSSVAVNSDDNDWYKIGLTNIATTAGGSPVKNISLDLLSYSASDGDIYELAVLPDMSDLEDDYGDAIMISILSFDEYMGGIDIGGDTWWYDDGDDTDGWTHDDNWTYDFWTPRHAWPANGQEDPDGFANGLDEDGWIYIMISYGWSAGANPPATRPGFTIDYQFELSFNSDEMVDTAGNYYKNATVFTPIGSKKSNIFMDSKYNVMDWYTFEGSDPSMLWNMSVQINRTDGVIWQQRTQTHLYDNWLQITLVWQNAGEDEIYDTADDSLWAYTRIMSAFFGGGMFIGDEFNVWLHNNWTEAADRSVTVGIMEIPVHAAMNGNSYLGTYYVDHSVWSEYEITVSIGEIAPNVPPTVTEVNLESDFEQDPTGGYLDTEYTLEVTYQDEDDDPPENVWVYLDKDTPYEKKVDIVGTPKDVFDTDYTSSDSSPGVPGKVYKLEMLGEDLNDEPFPHTVDVQVIDMIPEASIRTPVWSEWFNYEEGIRVWDDEPVERAPNWAGIDELREDDPTTYFPLEGLDGMFKDPENDFVGFGVWNETKGNWSEDYQSELMHIDILEYEGIWQAAITPEHNMHGSEPVSFQGWDEHSWINLTTTVTIRPANDPPMVFNLEIDGKEYKVDNVDPLRPTIHLEDQVTIDEDEEFTFTIVAEDTDLEDEREQLEYSYMRAPLSSDWDEDPEVGYNTGIVTFTPNNNDVKAGNDKMVFTIDDHGEDGDIKLEVYLEVTNVNDDPSIMIPTTTARTWKQFSRISIRPMATDEDKNDQITFSVNFEDQIGDEYDALVDQLPAMDPTKGIDWDINQNTGDFWFKIDDQNIWNTSTGMVKSQEIVLVFQATDKEGGTASTSINLILNDENEEPPKPDQIDIDPLKPKAKEPVTLSVDEVIDPDGDRLTYKWDFGDGSTGEGMEVTHTYITKGWKTVQMWVEDGQFSTEKISLRIEVEEEASTADDDDTTQPDDDDTTTVASNNNDDMMLIIIVVVVIVIIVIIVLVLIFLLIRKKPAPAAQMYPGYDQQALGAYGAQGLPPGAMGELPPQQTPELPPAEGYGYPEQAENLQPAGEVPVQQQEPVVTPAPEAPAAQPEMAAPQEQAPAGNACPSCGSAVDPTWFLCPNCKSPLQ